MTNYRNIFCLLTLFFLFSLSGLSQELRIDFKRINSEKEKQKTNGDYLNYLEKEVQKLIHSYGKLSKEYIYLQGFYLDEYNRIYQPYSTLNPILINEYADGRKELVELTRKVYGDTSWVYADAILLNGMNYTGTWSHSMGDSTFLTLMTLTDKAIAITNSTQAYSDEVRFSNLSLLYSQKGDVFFKVGLRDSAIKYYDKVLKIKKEYPLYDNFFPGFLGLYANVISIKSEHKGLEFLKEYEPLIKEKYKTNNETYYYYLKNLLSHALRNSDVDRELISYLSEADSICTNVFGRVSSEYVNYTLDYKLSAFKKMGWKSIVYQELINLNEDVFKKQEKLLSQNESVFMKYNLEWYYYYESINEQFNGVKWLKWVEKNDVDTNLNRFSFPSKITVYRELGDYYRFKNIDSCLLYYFKVLDLEELAKRTWGDYVVHQYHEIAKLLVNTEDSLTAVKAVNYCLLALNEFSNAYGEESGYFKSAQFTAGHLEFIISGGRNGFDEMWPEVYGQLLNPEFVPPFNTSVFQSYGDILNLANRPDSADFFYTQVYLRNNAAQIFRLLGSPEELQIKSLQDIYTQNYIILTQHLLRYKNSGYSFVSKELAEQLFRKNLVYQIQTYTNKAFENAKLDEDTAMLDRIKQDKMLYDSLLSSATKNAELLDSAYLGYDLDKNWLLQSYLVNQSKDSSNLKTLKREYSYTDIQQALRKEDCYIDIIRFLKNDKELGFSSDPYYALLIVDKDTKDKVEYFFIEDGKNFEHLVQADNLEEISSILSPLIARLKIYKKIYINPDGAFNLLNFYSLKDANDQYLIKSKTIIYINTLEGIFQSYKENGNHRASFFGDPVFDSGNNDSVSRRNSIFANYRFSALKALPYSKIEIESSSEILEKKGWKIKAYTKDRCTEAALKGETFSDILHIATHGFYISETDFENVNYAIKSNPYLRSGLIMGSSHNDRKDLNDNVLTAYEVMNLDLKNTSLVVLSACESAKGELRPGQGVYGIQRAFKIAGVKSVLVSVKNVDDKATQLLMDYFYSNVANGDDYPEALRGAQIKMSNHPLFKDPRYWAGFILIGQ